MNNSPPLAHTSYITIIFLDTTYQSGVFIFGTTTELPLEVRFEEGDHHSSEKGAVSKLRRFRKVNIKMQKTAIWDQNPVRRYNINVTIYVLCNKAQFQSTHSSETQRTRKIIIPNTEARYLGSKSGCNNPKNLNNIRN